jgi:ribosomal protein L20
VKGTDTEFQFVYRQRVLAKARGYFSREERQWRFELTEVDRERYEAVRAYFAGRR